ncbi:solute carrier family 2, facilitated glucose transporter member 5-like [Elgaria multicarinata webbii]|uniref:solute carrier family 2, facilitated glucose transporter member 5-like n=1 Tax=Elgaria multicarinata webbii TaxID=159646 RepID=UPI002FCD4E19
MISAILMACSKPIQSYEFIICARLIVGTCSGISFSIVPMYLTELAPKNLRGAIGSIPYLFIILGSLTAHIFGFSKALGTQEGWPILLSLTGIPALFQAVVLPFFPESPRYLLIQRQNEPKARQALKKLRGWDDVEEEMEELQQENLGESTEKKMDVLKLLWFGELRWHLLSTIVLMAGQQLSGINAAQYYSERIFLSTGLGENIVWYIRLLLYILLMFITLLAIWTVDTSGRRTLLLVGYGICSICCVLITMSLELQSNVLWMSYFSSSFITVFFIGQSVGPGPVTNVLISELFLQSSRSTAFVIAGCVHWLFKFLIAVMYLHIDVHIEPYSFLIFWPLCITTFIYISKVIPETKGKTFLEIRRIVAIHETRRMLIRDLADMD